MYTENVVFVIDYFTVLAATNIWGVCKISKTSFLVGILTTKCGHIGSWQK